MTTPLSITSRSQGQIFGAKPSIAEFERQLETDPSYKAFNKLCDTVATLGSMTSSIAGLVGHSMQLLRFFILKMKTAQDVM